MQPRICDKEQIHKREISNRGPNAFSHNCNLECSVIIHPRENSYRCKLRKKTFHIESLPETAEKTHTEKIIQKGII